MTLAPIVHALLVASDKLELVTLEMPTPETDDAQVLLTALARAAQLTAEHLKAEQAAMEKKLERVG